MDNKAYCLDVVRAINETIEDDDWFENQEKIQFIYDRTEELMNEMYFKGATNDNLD